MIKNFTLCAALWMAVSSFTFSAQADELPIVTVPVAEWTEGNYYFLSTVGNKFLSLHHEKQDSVVLIPLDDWSEEKLNADLALWEIKAVETSAAGVSYQIKNKRTQELLSFEKEIDAEPVLDATGVSEWSLVKTSVSDADAYVVKSQISSTEAMELRLGDENKIIFEGGTSIPFRILYPHKDKLMEATDLGDGFSTFQLSFGDTYEGDIFSGKDLIATPSEDAGYLLLQEKGNETYADGTKKYFGIDTLETVGAGFNFSYDSIRTTIKPNAAMKLFKFTVDMKNDSLTMYVKATPDSDAEDVIKVAFAQLGDKKVLTVSADDDMKHPFITSSRGVPATISTGSGVYFLKSASKGENGDLYYQTATTFMDKDETPVEHLYNGQWYIKERNGKYAVVDRATNSVLLMYQEIFEVAGMENTFLFGEDSVTVIATDVKLTDKYIGSLAYTEEELAANGFALHLIPGAAVGIPYLNTYVTDSILMLTGEEVANEVIFKLMPGEAEAVAGAKELGDTIFMFPYKLRTLFDDKMIAAHEANELKLAETNAPLVFRINEGETEDTYTMQAININTLAAYMGMDMQTGQLVLTETPANFAILMEEAPEYKTMEDGFKRFSTNNNSLTMNPNTLFAELKMEGNEITKAGYVVDNFSLKVEKAANSPVGKPLYFISTEQGGVTYYLATKDTLDGHYAMFMTHDSITTMKNSPALYAFKVVENGGYYLENQSELAKEAGHPYMGMLNGKAVMEAAPVAEFTIEEAPEPVANEAIEAPTTVQVISGVGEFHIRNAAGKRITLSNILGQTIGSRYIATDYETVQATRGIMIVSVEDDKAFKVIVK